LVYELDHLGLIVHRGARSSEMDWQRCAGSVWGPAAARWLVSIFQIAPAIFQIKKPATSKNPPRIQSTLALNNAAGGFPPLPPAAVESRHIGHAAAVEQRIGKSTSN
jgi:hypothetical protein